MPNLFDPLTLRGVTFRNRIGVAPMCQYSAEDGFANDWHLVHLGSRAVGGAGLIIAEATAVEARGRISPQDLGIWQDAHIEPLARITQFLREHGAASGIQLAHAGRKAATYRPWEGRSAVPEDQGGWQVIGPSAIPFVEDYHKPQAMTLDDIQAVVAAFVAAAKRAAAAGFDVVEIHAAHGYLIHSFYSPLSNQRTDEYGGDFDGRIRLLMEIVAAVRAVWDKPLFVRISATDWVDGGWTLEDSVELAKRLKTAGVDLVDCSSGGVVAGVTYATGASYQVPLADAVRNQAGIPTAAVGMITQAMQADEIIRNGRADMVLLAREFLRQPYWPHAAALELHQADQRDLPPQYVRAF